MALKESLAERLNIRIMIWLSASKGEDQLLFWGKVHGKQVGLATSTSFF
ncbi:MAG: hypothetical protein KKD63_03065 [Proteobacteria bacterium]|nr:hypothetical protein [Pseudomonadota bacterium]